MMFYSIKDLEHLSGIKAHTIRIWEKRYQLFDPIRTSTNIRNYSDEDVRKILNVAMLVKSGYKISNVAAFGDEKIQAEVIRIYRNSTDTEKYIDQLLFQAINLNTFGLEELLDKIFNENGLSKTIQQVIFPFFERIGILWQTGSIFTSHEHFVSNLIRNRMIREIGKIKVSESAKSALFFLHENEWHELGLLYFNLLAAQAGLRCVYLGQSLPYSDLENLLTKNDFDFVFTSFIQAIEKPDLEQYLSNLSLLFKRSKILIAGRQLAVHKPKLPGNVEVIRNKNEFRRKIAV